MSHHLFQHMIENGFKFVTPGNPGIKQLADHKTRGIAISRLPRRKGLCKWCWKKPTPSGRQFYCSESCKLSTEIYCYPQGNWSWRILEKRQNGKCAKCEYEFGSKIQKRHDGTDDNGEIDHIIPIFQGGVALGLENLQLLCTPCHRVKSANERRKNHTHVID